MELLLTTVLSYLVSLAANSTSSKLGKIQEQKLKELLSNDKKLLANLQSDITVEDHVSTACKILAKNLKTKGLTTLDIKTWSLLSDAEFQKDFTQWFTAGNIPETDKAKERILDKIEYALAESDLEIPCIEKIKADFFNNLEISVFSNDIMANWRLGKSLEYLRGITEYLKRNAEEAGGIYSETKKNQAIAKYCDMALNSWDIIDLSGLPEDDFHLATQSILLRQLYMPLRIEFENTNDDIELESALTLLEKKRDNRRKKEAGHILNIDFEDKDGVQKGCSIGEKLHESNRLVILGDPGGGKTTMMRWLATAYLLRFKKDKSFSKVPDTSSLPVKTLLPILIRCRDLGEQDLCRSFDDFLLQHLKKTELRPEQAAVMKAVILERMANGHSLLLIDGLDEIADVRVRIQFCQELERTTARYPDATVIVTSRIVGYRDMPHRVSAGFKHGQISELVRKDKLEFARRWVEVTEQNKPLSEREVKIKELEEAILYNDRIDRLTGNPMLLTTLALVKRKVGKLPNKRTKLYSEAVSVLLNWNRSLYETIDEEEAIPQLEFLAYEMCRMGVQSLANEDMISILEDFRVEYPNVRAVKKRSPEEFLKLLEARSSIIIKSGGLWQDKNTEKHVWEFRHLTFQEYLAARALIDGRYKERDKKLTIAEQVIDLAGTVDESGTDNVITESWRETLRLLVADCKDDDVDAVLTSILTPTEAEDIALTCRPRAVLAASCLADEPNVSESLAINVLTHLVQVICDSDGNGNAHSSLDRAAIELQSSLWRETFREILITAFCKNTSEFRCHIGGVWGMTSPSGLITDKISENKFVAKISEKLTSEHRFVRMSACLELMNAAFLGKISDPKEIPQLLMSNLFHDAYETHTAIWALVWLNGGWAGNKQSGEFWESDDTTNNLLYEVYKTIDAEEVFTKACIVGILGKHDTKLSEEVIISALNSKNRRLVLSGIRAIREHAKPKFEKHLIEHLHAIDRMEYIETARSLVEIDTESAVSAVISSVDLDTKQEHSLISLSSIISSSKTLQAIKFIGSILKLKNKSNSRTYISHLCRFNNDLALNEIIAYCQDMNLESIKSIEGTIERHSSPEFYMNFKKKVEVVINRKKIMN